MYIINVTFFLSTLVVTFFISNFCEANFCNSHVCDETTRAFCKFELSTSPARHCIDYEKTIKTSADRQDILDKINSRRDKIASGDIRSLPSAENMIKMEWSLELEISAQWWANQCVPYNELDSIDICTDLDKDNIGQNIATVIGDSPGLTPAILVDVWYMELLNINASLISRYRPSNQKNLRHYDYFTQLAWAESNLVGCGSVKFKDLSDRRQNRTINRLVCNFSPGGNLLEERVYNEGFPCSRCPKGGMCDLKYPSLCNSEITVKDKTKFKEYGIKFNSIYQNVTFNMHVTNINENKSSINSKINNDEHSFNTATESFLMETGDENATTFDYLAQLFRTTSNTEQNTNNLKTCKDVMPVEDFIDIFKKRLIKDQVLKQFLLSSKLTDNNENSESSYTDATVAELMSNIYSTKEVSTSTKPAEPDYFNSTLLVNLVEAVIFKNNDKSSTVDKGEETTNIVSDVNAVRIKPELGEIQINLHSTGHYFFPEDDSEQQGIKETTDTYYDLSSFPVSDIVLEIQELKRNRGTKDFLDEILESDFETENTTESHFPSTTLLKSNKNGSDKEFLRNSEFLLLKKPMSRSKRSDHKLNTDGNLETAHRIKKYSRFRIKNSDVTVHLIDYQDLLRKIALDLDNLKLNDRFHCTGIFSKTSNNKPSLFFLLSLLILHLFHLL